MSIVVDPTTLAVVRSQRRATASLTAPHPLTKALSLPRSVKPLACAIHTHRLRKPVEAFHILYQAQFLVVTQSPTIFSLPFGTPLREMAREHLGPTLRRGQRYRMSEAVVPPRIPSQAIIHLSIPPPPQTPPRTTPSTNPTPLLPLAAPRREGLKLICQGRDKAQVGQVPIRPLTTWENTLHPTTHREWIPSQPLAEFPQRLAIAFTMAQSCRPTRRCPLSKIMITCSDGLSLSSGLHGLYISKLYFCAFASFACNILYSLSPLGCVGLYFTYPQPVFLTMDIVKNVFLLWSFLGPPTFSSLTTGQKFRARIRSGTRDKTRSSCAGATSFLPPSPILLWLPPLSLLP